MGFGCNCSVRSGYAAGVRYHVGGGSADGGRKG